MNSLKTFSKADEALLYAEHKKSLLYIVYVFGKVKKTGKKIKHLYKVVVHK